MLQMPRMHGAVVARALLPGAVLARGVLARAILAGGGTSPEPSSPEATSPEPASSHEQWSSRRRGAAGRGGRTVRGGRRERVGGSKGRGRAARRAPPRTQTGSPSAPELLRRFEPLRARAGGASDRGHGRDVYDAGGGEGNEAGTGTGRRDLQVHVADDLVLLVVALDDGTESPRRGFLVALPRARANRSEFWASSGSRVGRWRGHAWATTCSVARKAPRKRVAPTTATIAGPRPNIRRRARASRSDHSKRVAALLAAQNGWVSATDVWGGVYGVRPDLSDFAAVRKSGRMSGRGSMSR